MPKTDDAMFYQLYFQTPGVAEAELESDVGAYMRGILERLPFYWRWKSRRRAARPPIPDDIRDLVRTVSRHNAL